MVRKRKNSDETRTVPRLTRQRRGLDDETDPDSTLVEKPAETPSTRRRTYRKKTLAAPDDPPMSTRSRRVRGVLTEVDNALRENISPIQTPVKLTRSRAKASSTRANPVLDSPGSPIEKPARNSPAGLKNAKSSLLGRTVETPRKVSLKKKSNPFVKSGDDTITPESSPMLVNLTPHRSSKTPKKSPVNIGSPKTHSLSPLRLSKTPRKLTISVESPATSDKSSVSLSNQSSAEDNLADAIKPFLILTDVVKSGIPKTETTSDVGNSSKSPPTFVTETKLMLKKSCDRSLSPAKRLGTLASKIRKSPVGTATPIRKTSSAKATLVKKQLASATVVGVQISTPNGTPKRTPDNVRPLNRENPESPKRPKSTVKKRSPITSLGTPLRPIMELEKSLGEKSAPSPCLVAPKKISLLLNLASSSPGTTPRGRIRRSLHLTPDFKKFPSDFTSSPIPTPKKIGQVPSPLGLGNLGEMKQINDESLELVDGSKFMNVSDDGHNITFELSKEATLAKENENEKNKTGKTAEESEARDATYELAEPKTPNLKKKSRKRSLSNVEPDKCTPEAKKRCRVRFASPAQNKTPATPFGSASKSLPTVKTPVTERIRTRLSRGLDSIRRRSKSLTKIDDKTPNTRTGVKRRSVSASDLTDKTPKFNQTIQDSINRLSRPRRSISSEAKLEIKSLVPRKAPNFAQIHQKKFEQLESLVDAKKRVAKRHVELNTLPSTRATPQSSSAVLPESSAPQPSKKPVAPEARNPAYNRFGFKLRKAEALQLINKKPSAAARSKNYRENNRSILKGVRTNRQFELLMKARNMKEG